MKSCNDILKRRRNRIWIAVKVWRGIPDKIKVFSTETAARRTERAWRAKSNPDYDESAVFSALI
jgi:hypothetical protein